MEYEKTVNEALFGALVKAIAETQNVVADAQNPFHKNSYATLGAHLNAIKPIFAKHGLAILQFPIGSSNTIGIKTIVIHKDGGQLSESVVIPTSEELKAQEAGSIFSYMRRYSLASIAGIATDDDDGESNRAPAPVVTKFISNEKPSVQQAKPVIKTASPSNSSTSSNPELQQALSYIVPFGKNKGLTLGELQEKSLSWYIEEYQPKPYKGQITEADKAFRDALDTIRDSRKTPEPQQAEEDNVPF